MWWWGGGTHVTMERAPHSYILRAGKCLLNIISWSERKERGIFYINMLMYTNQTIMIDKRGQIQENTQV